VFILEQFLNQFLVFVFVLTRFTGLALTAPVFGTRSAPMQVRALLAVAISFLVAPLYWGAEIGKPENLLQMVTLMGQEAVVGLTIGVGMMFLFSSLQLTGHVVGQMSGMQLADVFDPTFNSSVPVFAQLLELIALAVFFGIGGHRQVLSALLDTFTWIPPGDASFSAEMTPALVQLLQVAFVVGVRTAAPMITALLMSMLVLGLISRTLPQLNILAVGFSLNMMVMMGTMFMALGAIIYVFQEQAIQAIEHLRSALTVVP
jgi:flagellar biosynthesis protein FliR